MLKPYRIPTKKTIIERIRESDAAYFCAMIAVLSALMALAEFLCWIVGAADPSLTIYK